LIYSVCTLTRSETSDVVESFEKQFPDFKRVAVINPLKPELPASPQIWIWPQDAGGNGMFVAVWEKS
jgi:16S rRNA (cytosine967-C5)-methyltransferase